MLEVETNIEDIIKNKDYKALSAHLKNGVNEYLNSDVFKNYLTFISKFHKYSEKNSRLILAQKRNAKNVAGFKKWKELGRSVQKGSKAIYIYSPSQKFKKDEQGNKIKNEKGEFEKEIFFILRPVFDVSQTVGKELPKPVNELQNNLNDRDNFVELFNQLAEISPVKVKVVNAGKLEDGVKGFYRPSDQTINIRQGMGQEQTIKTLIHEMVHAELHTNSTANFGSDEYSIHEFEAESVAYIVASHLDIDTSEYSFGYLSSWTQQGKTIDDLQDSLATITSEAQGLINNIDKALGETISIDKVENAFEDRLQTAKGLTESDSFEQTEKKTELSPKV